VKFQVGGDGLSPYQAGEKYPFGALEDEQRMLPGEQLRDDGIGLCRMPDDDELLTSASRVVHEIEQAGSVLDQVEHVTPSCRLRGDEICKLHHRCGT
jgi:hypothetical protein